MKNAIIIGLVVIASVLGFVVIWQNYKPANQGANTEETTITDSGSLSNKEINLSNRGLTSLDKNILDNKTVTKLNVSGNELTGSLPAEIRKLTNLTELDASDNKMTGIPAEIGQLSSLRIANFANNDLSGLPMEIGNLKSLQTLDLRGNPNVSSTDLAQIRTKSPNAQILTD